VLRREREFTKSANATSDGHKSEAEGWRERERGERKRDRERIEG